MVEHHVHDHHVGHAHTYTYDPTSRLLTADGVNYSYDANGNRTMTGCATTANRTTTGGTYTYTYDAESNLTEKTKGSGLETWYYTYNQQQWIIYDLILCHQITYEKRPHFSALSFPRPHFSSL